MAKESRKRGDQDISFETRALLRKPLVAFTESGFKGYFKNLLKGVFGASIGHSVTPASKA
jgi:hypothetical protein